MKTKRRIQAGIFLAAVLGSSLGCVERKASAQSSDKPDKEASSAAEMAEQVTKKPNPTGAEHDPRIIAADRSAEVLDSALRTLHEKLGGLREAFQTRPETTEAALKTATNLKPLAEDARETCDTIIRRTEDLEQELKLTGRGYEALAERYRSRANLFHEPEFKAIELGWAVHFEQLAEETPRRRRFVAQFLDQMVENRRSLREASACLGDVEAAVKVLRAGPDRPLAVSRTAAAFQSRMQEFMRMIEEFQKGLRTPLLPKPEETKVTAPPTVAKPTETKPVPSTPNSDGKSGATIPAIDSKPMESPGAPAPESKPDTPQQTVPKAPEVQIERQVSTAIANPSVPYQAPVIVGPHSPLLPWSSGPVFVCNSVPTPIPVQPRCGIRP